MRLITACVCVVSITGYRTIATQENVSKPFDYSSRVDASDAFRINKDFSLSPNGKKVVVCGMHKWRNSGWSLWDVESCRKVSTGRVISNAHCVAISPDGKYVAAGGDS